MATLLPALTWLLSLLVWGLVLTALLLATLAALLILLAALILLRVLLVLIGHRKLSFYCSVNLIYRCLSNAGFTTVFLFFIYGTFCLRKSLAKQLDAQLTTSQRNTDGIQKMTAVEVAPA